MEGIGERPWTANCTVVAVDTASLSYRACSTCERTLPDDPATTLCPVCSQKTSTASSNRLYRLLLSIATADKVMVVICFDRAAKPLFGCSADEFFEFCRLHPCAAEKVGEVMEGEMCRMTLSRPQSGNAQHLRAVSVVPLRTGFSPVMETLRKIYSIGVGTSSSRRANFELLSL